MAKSLVTQKEWYDIMGTTVERQQILAKGGSTNYARGDNYPMYYVNWYEAIEYCNKRSLKESRMPVYVIDGEKECLINNEKTFSDEKIFLACGCIIFYILKSFDTNRKTGMGR